VDRSDVAQEAVQDALRAHRIGHEVYTADNELYMETFSTPDLTGFLCCLRRKSGTLPYLYFFSL
jgi:hypothetical protein